ncbi:hypothetical protein [Sporolactobacillus terrae]|uniref:hypothetical protein n=1 Tax=Sporolactobacillus terrae TaxID=269673 RepID=UPI00048F2AFA|nr:hypothetical protein [Sporolactobacillus terrae]
MKKKKWMYFVFISVIAALLMAAAWWIAAGAINPAMRTPSTDLSREAFHGMRIGDSIESKAFVRRFGKPIPRAQKDRKLVYYSWKGGLVTASKKAEPHKGRIAAFYLLKMQRVRLGNVFSDPLPALPSFSFRPSNPLKTYREIQIGDSKEQVIRHYGTDYYSFNIREGGQIIGYVDHKNEMKLEFNMNKHAQVQSIRLAEEGMK